jgi:hypothetical protein
MSEKAIEYLIEGKEKGKSIGDVVQGYADLETLKLKEKIRRLEDSIETKDKLLKLRANTISELE